MHQAHDLIFSSNIILSNPLVHVATINISKDFALPISNNAEFVVYTKRLPTPKRHTKAGSLTVTHS
jgi:hypothetical protein